MDAEGMAGSLLWTKIAPTTPAKPDWASLPDVLLHGRRVELDKPSAIARLAMLLWTSPRHNITPQSVGSMR